MTLGKQARRLLAATLSLGCGCWLFLCPQIRAQGTAAVLLAPTADESSLSAAPSALALGELEAMALAANPTIAAAQALVDQERGLWLQVGLYPNPSFGYLRTDPDRALRSQTQGIFFSQEVVTPGKRQLNRAIESAGIRAAEWQLNAQRQRVINDVRIRFYDVLGAQRAVGSALELEKLALEGVQMTERLLKAKEIPRTDLVRSEIQLQVIRVSLQDARNRYQAAWKQLAYMMGRPDLQAARLDGDLEADIAQLNWEESLQKLLAAHPVLRSQEAKIREARYTWKRARMEAIPNLSVQVVAQRDSVENFSSVSTLLAVPVPLFNRNQGNVYNAAAAIRQQEKELERQQLALYDQFALSFRQYETARNHAERIKAEILPRVKENLDLTMQAFTKAGKINVFRLIEARQLYFETNTAYIDALVELHKTSIEIDGMLLTGGLNPTEIGTALQAQPGLIGPGVRSLLLQQLQEGAGKNRLLPGAVQGATER